MSRTDSAVDIVIYHNPECGTSRNALAMIRNAGIEPTVIEYAEGHRFPHDRQANAALASALALALDGDDTREQRARL